MKIRHHHLLVGALLLLCSTTAFAQAPLASYTGSTGTLFTVDSRTIERGRFSFGFSAANFDQLYPEAPELRPGSDRPFRGFDIDRGEFRLFLNYGLTDSWEVSLSQPLIHYNQNIGDVAGFAEGYPHVGEFVESGRGNLRLATKLRFYDVGRVGLAGSLAVDLPTGDTDQGITAGSADVTAGIHADFDRLTLAVAYRIRGDRSAEDTPLGVEFPLANELHLDAAWRWPSARLPRTDWIVELNGAILEKVDRAPDGPFYVAGGARHQFRDSCISIDLAFNFNVAMALTDNPSHPLGGLFTIQCAF